MYACEGKWYLVSNWGPSYLNYNIFSKEGRIWKHRCRQKGSILNSLAAIIHSAADYKKQPTPCEITCQGQCLTACQKKNLVHRTSIRRKRKREPWRTQHLGLPRSHTTRREINGSLLPSLKSLFPFLHKHLWPKPIHIT